MDGMRQTKINTSDFEKAFDSVDHDFLNTAAEEKALKFV